MGLQGLLLVLGAALLQLPTSSFAQQAETAHTHEHYVEIAKQRKLMHQMIWQTLDGKREILTEMKKIKAETFRVPGWNRNWSDVAEMMKDPIVQPSPDVMGEKIARCVGTLGSWCQAWWSQTQVPWKPAPRGSKECPGNCNGNGQCNYDTGICLCDAGWKGDNCSIPFKRPCSHRYRSPNDPFGIPVHNLGPDGHDKDWTVPGWTASRCGGYCDDTLGICYCGFNSTYRHIPAPPGSPPGTPPIQRGRALVNPCQPAADPQGRKTDWGRTPFESLYGKQGWCEIPPGSAGFTCPCALDGVGGIWCENGHRAFCVNQVGLCACVCPTSCMRRVPVPTNPQHVGYPGGRLCNLRGECNEGMCVCDPGWYGSTCDRKKAGLPIEPIKPERLAIPESTIVWRPSAAAEEPPPRPARKRPLIYVYDLPPDYNSRQLQYRLAAQACVFRKFDPQNRTVWVEAGYGAEIYLHEVLSASSHRTFEPEEADFFFVPTYVTCYLWPTHGWSDGPWYHAPTPNPRPMHASNMMLEVKDWIASHLPYWNKTQGRDHIFLALHDEGACYMPTELYNNSIFLVHWGRMDLEHASGTGWPPDNYSHPIVFPGYQDRDWRENYKGHPCYRPDKDLVIPHFKHFGQWHFSPLLGVPPLRRDVLCYFRGDIGFYREWWYSRGIRQSLYRLAMEDNWREKYNIMIGERGNYPGDYSEMLARSKFCLVLPGDGHSARAEDAILHGCLPVVIMDNVHAAMESIIDWSKFSIRVPQNRLHELPQILMAVNETTIYQMQKNLAQVWFRFAYTTGPFHRSELRTKYAHIKPVAEAENKFLPPGHPYRPLTRYPVRQDAFHTIMQWLMGRIPYIKANKWGSGSPQ